MEVPLLEFYASCPQGFERLLADELKRLAMRRVRPLKGGVAFFGTQADGYRACLWSRLASRITRVLKRVPAYDAAALFEGARQLAWERHVNPASTISVEARGTNDELRNTQFVALKVKDAICDRLRETCGSRPDVAPRRADVPVWVSVHGDKATLALDYAGESLHRRGYRISGEQVEAPLKEALAAGVLVWGGWEHAASPFVRRALAKRDRLAQMPAAPSFIDPACGGGTLVLEAAMMAADRAPGLSRDYWGFQGHADFDAAAWEALLSEADERFEAGLQSMPVLLGADIDARSIQIAQGNARRLGMAPFVRFLCADCADLEKTMASSSVNPVEPGFVVCNPPYGVRLAGAGQKRFVESLARGLSSLGDAWRMVLISPDEQLDVELGYEACESMPAKNGAIDVTLRSYDLGKSLLQEACITTLDGRELPIRVYSEHVLQFAARLRKMAKARRKWAAKNDVHAYRIYDADLPNYAVSVDWFEESGSGAPFALVNEYKAPKEIEEKKAAQRFSDAVTVVRALLEVPEGHLFTRLRSRAKGGSQYADGGSRGVSSRRDLRGGGEQPERSLSCGMEESGFLVVDESGLAFELNLSRYLDTGLFLDQRLTRQLIRDRSEGKSFLNLFAYTGTASVYAAAGGARETTTVDLSNTYLDWSRRNLERNGFTGRLHRLYRADALTWLQRAADEGWRYDLVFVDPPTFSNSKGMGQRNWDIQRDHVELLSGVSRLLNPGGTIMFSGNLRSFKLDSSAVEGLGLTVSDLTAQTIPEDFARNPRIHFCYLLEGRKDPTPTRTERFA